MINVSVFDLVFTEFSVTILVKFLKNSCELFPLIFAEQLTSDKGKGGGFHHVVGVELGQVVKSIFREALVDF